MGSTSTTTWIINYESKTHAVDSKISGSFSLRIRGVERTLVRSPSGRETLVTQRTVVDMKDAAVAEIPPAFLAGEEICCGYVADVLSKAKINSYTQQRIVPKICKDAINMSRRLGEEETKGFLVEAEVDEVREISLNKLLSIDDYDSQGQRRPIEQDCIICLEELTPGGERKIMKLDCSHNFHIGIVFSGYTANMYVQLVVTTSTTPAEESAPRDDNFLNYL